MYYYYNYWLFLLLLFLLFFSPLFIIVVVFVCIDFLICNFHLLLVKVWDTTVFVYGLNLVFYKIKAKISLRTFFQMRSPVAPLLLLFLVLLLLSFELKNRFNSRSAVLFVYTERTIEPVMRSLPTTGPLFLYFANCGDTRTLSSVCLLLLTDIMTTRRASLVSRWSFKFNLLTGLTRSPREWCQI